MDRQLHQHSQECQTARLMPFSITFPLVKPRLYRISKIGAEAFHCRCLRPFD